MCPGDKDKTLDKTRAQSYVPRQVSALKMHTECAKDGVSCLTSVLFIVVQLVGYRWRDHLRLIFGFRATVFKGA